MTNDGDLTRSRHSVCKVGSDARGDAGGPAMERLLFAEHGVRRGERGHSGLDGGRLVGLAAYMARRKQVRVVERKKLVGLFPRIGRCKRSHEGYRRLAKVELRGRGVRVVERVSDGAGGRTWRQRILVRHQVATRWTRSSSGDSVACHFNKRRTRDGRRSCNLRSALSPANHQRPMIEVELGTAQADRAILSGSFQVAQLTAAGRNKSARFAASIKMWILYTRSKTRDIAHAELGKRSSETAMQLALDPPKLLLLFLPHARHPADTPSGLIDDLLNHRRGAQTAERPPAAITHRCRHRHPSPSLAEPLRPSFKLQLHPSSPS